MKKFNLFILAAAASVLFAACGAPAENKPANAANTNANVAKPVAAAPTADILLALDKQANEAYVKNDGKFFEGFLSDKFVSYDGGQRMGKADVVKMIGSGKCDVKEGWKLEDPQMAKIDDDTYVLSYKGTFDGSCKGADGKSMKIPSPTRAATVWSRNGDKWVAVYHGENLIVEPKAAPAAPAKPDAKKEEPKKEEPKKEEPKAEVKKEEPKKDAPKKDEKAAANAATADAPAPAPKPVADPNPDALAKLHTSGWEAFKAKDAKKFDELLTANFSNVDPIGGWMTGKANVIKQWTETMKCEGITKVSVTDGFASAISPTVELFTLKGTADGTCDGQKNGPLYQTTVYVKEGEAWKLAFMFESVAK